MINVPGSSNLDQGSTESLEADLCTFLYRAFSTLGALEVLYFDEVILSFLWHFEV